jgi:nitrogen fixation protein FixH
VFQRAHGGKHANPFSALSTGFFAATVEFSEKCWAVRHHDITGLEVSYHDARLLLCEGVCGRVLTVLQADISEGEKE